MWKFTQGHKQLGHYGQNSCYPNLKFNMAHSKDLVEVQSLFINAHHGKWIKVINGGDNLGHLRRGCVCVYVCMYIYYISMYICMYMCIYIYIYMYMQVQLKLGCEG